MAKITKSTPFKDTWDAFKKAGVCSEAIDWALADKCLDKTWGGFISIKKGTKEMQSHAIGTLRIYYDYFDDEIRKDLIAAVINPMAAFQLYLNLNLTDEDDNLLEAKFKGKLPQAEKELVEGIVVRVKK